MKPIFSLSLIFVTSVAFGKSTPHTISELEVVRAFMDCPNEARILIDNKNYLIDGSLESGGGFYVYQFVFGKSSDPYKPYVTLKVSQDHQGGGGGGPGGPIAPPTSPGG